MTNIYLETDRLKIIPLSIAQFELLLSDEIKLESELGLNASSEYMNELVLNAKKQQYNKALTNPDKYIWFTSWEIILKSENRIIGSANFKNIPDMEKSVEIGYGIHSIYKNRGYMTEAVTIMCGWALSQPEVDYILAETYKDNCPSQKVLKKCGMVLIKETDISYWWQLGKEQLIKNVL